MIKSLSDLKLKENELNMTCKGNHFFFFFYFFFHFFLQKKKKKS